MLTAAELRLLASQCRSWSATPDPEIATQMTLFAAEFERLAREKELPLPAAGDGGRLPGVRAHYRQGKVPPPSAAAAISGASLR